MHHRISGIGMHQPLMTQPVEQFIPVRCRQKFVQRVGWMRLAYAGGHHQQVQVMVAECDYRAIAEIAQEAQNGQCLRSAVDDIACGPQRIARRIERNTVQQLSQLVITTLDIADRVCRHCNCPVWLLKQKRRSSAAPFEVTADDYFAKPAR